MDKRLGVMRRLRAFFPFNGQTVGSVSINGQTVGSDVQVARVVLFIDGEQVAAAT